MPRSPISELSQASPEARAAAGIPVDVYEHFQMCNETVAIIDEKKLAQMNALPKVA